jgi:hypothetical protein
MSAEASTDYADDTDWKNLRVRLGSSINLICVISAAKYLERFFQGEPSFVQGFPDNDAVDPETTDSL